MSHFTVLVPADDLGDLYEKLIPYYEYGCSVENDEELERRGLLRFHSVEDEYRQRYEDESATMVRLPGGELKFRWDEEFRVPILEWKPGGPDYEYPEGSEFVDIPFKDVYNSFGEFVDDYAGYQYDEDEGTWGYWHNQNAKWDWYSVGGRWMGSLPLIPADPKPVIMLRGKKEIAGLSRTEVDFLVNLYARNRERFDEVVAKYEGKSEEIRKYVEQLFAGMNGDAPVTIDARPDGAGDGSPGVFNEPHNNPLLADFAFVKDVDWDKLRQERLDTVMGEYDAFHLNVGELRDNGGVAEPVMKKARDTWDDEEGRGPIVRDAFASIEDYALASEASDAFFISFRKLADLFYKSRDEYMAMFSTQAVTFAFIDTEGNWNQEGQMGWWGMVDRDKATEDYDATFWQFIKSLEPDQMVFVVDCHI